MAITDFIKSVLQPEGVDELLERFPTKVGTFGFDPWGFNIKGVKATLGLGKLAFEKYFRVEVHGLEHVPPSGRALIVGNHSGQIPIDGFLLGYALLTNPHAPRAAKAMMERFVPTVPFISQWFAEVGGVVGDPINCARMLEAEEAIIVFPEGARGISKPFRDRYKLQRFGTGFMHLAVNHDCPVIPVGIVGMEEAVISLGNPMNIARRLRLPSAPLVLPAVLPTKVIIHIGEPMYFEKAVDREDLMQAYSNDVKLAIRNLVDKGLEKRKGIFG